MQHVERALAPIAEMSLWAASTCTALRSSADTNGTCTPPDPNGHDEIRGDSKHLNHPICLPPSQLGGHDKKSFNNHDLSLHSLIRPIFYTDAEEREEEGSQLPGEWCFEEEVRRSVADSPPTVWGGPPTPLLGVSMCSVLTCDGASPPNCFGLLPRILTDTPPTKNKITSGFTVTAARAHKYDCWDVVARQRPPIPRPILPGAGYANVAVASDAAREREVDAIGRRAHDGYSYVHGGRRHEGNLSLAYAPVPSRRLERAPMRALRADVACDTSDLHLYL